MAYLHSNAWRPGLSGARLLRELKQRGYKGSYTVVNDVPDEFR